GVLALVEDDEAVVQGTPTHIGQRGHLDYLFLDQLGNLFEAEHFVERIVQRAQVGIDLLRQVAGQEAQLLAGLDRRAHQQDTADLFALQGIHGAGDRQVGLAGTGRTNAEVDIVLLDRAHIGLLVRPTGLDGHALGAQYHRLVTIAVLQRFAEVFQARLLQIQVHGIRRQIPVVPGFAIELAQDRLGGAGDGGVANQLEMVAAVADFDAEALLDHAEVFIELAAETGEAPGVYGLDAEAMDSQGNRSEEHTSELQSREKLVCRLL